MNTYKFIDPKLNKSFKKLLNEHKIKYTTSSDGTITLSHDSDEGLIDDLKCIIRDSVFKTAWQIFSLPKDSPKEWNENLINHLKENTIPFIEEIENGEFVTATPIDFEIPDAIYNYD